MDILDRINARLTDSDKQLLADAIAEILKLRSERQRCRRLLTDIFNCDDAESLPIDLRNRIDFEITGAKSTPETAS